jgi:DNA-binding response OmpR family regulator
MKENLSVLLVEDDKFWVEEITKSLKSNHFELSVANDILTTVEKIKKEKFDAIVLDLNLPDSSASKTIEKVIPLVPFTPVIILTTVSDENIISKAIGFGVHDFIVKSKFSEQLLVHSISIAIRKIQEQLDKNKKKEQDQILSYIKTVKEKLLKTQATLDKMFK